MSRVNIINKLAKFLKYEVGYILFIVFTIAVCTSWLWVPPLVARRLAYEERVLGEYSYKAIYAVRLSDGRVIKCEHDEIWTKVWRKEK